MHRRNQKGFRIYRCGIAVRDKAKILIVKLEPPIPLYGCPRDYDFGFKSLSAHAIQWVVVSVYLGEPLPDPADFDNYIDWFS